MTIMEGYESVHVILVVRAYLNRHLLDDLLCYKVLLPLFTDSAVCWNFLVRTGSSDLCTKVVCTVSITLLA